MTDADFEAWIQYNLWFARSTFEEAGTLKAMAVMMATINPVTKEKMEPPQPVPIMADRFDDKTKDAFAKTVQTMCRNHKACAVLFMSEMWMGHSMERFKKYGNVRDDPQRQEGIIVSIERLGRQPRAWLAIITRDGKQAMLHEFFEVPPGGQGRFIDLLGNSQVQ